MRKAAVHLAREAGRGARIDLRLGFLLLAVRLRDGVADRHSGLVRVRETDAADLTQREFHLRIGDGFIFVSILHTDVHIAHIHVRPELYDAHSVARLEHRALAEAVVDRVIESRDRLAVVGDVQQSEEVVFRRTAGVPEGDAVQDALYALAGVPLRGFARILGLVCRRKRAVQKQRPVVVLERHVELTLRLGVLGHLEHAADLVRAGSVNVPQVVLGQEGEGISGLLAFVVVRPGLHITEGDVRRKTDAGCVLGLRLTVHVVILELGRGGDIDLYLAGNIPARRGQKGLDALRSRAVGFVDLELESVVILRCEELIPLLRIILGISDQREERRQQSDGEKSAHYSSSSSSIWKIVPRMSFWTFSKAFNSLFESSFGL